MTKRRQQTKFTHTNAWLLMAWIFFFFFALILGGFLKSEPKAYDIYDPSKLTSDFELPRITVPYLAENVEAEIRKAFGDLGEKVVRQAIKVARCESGLRPKAENTESKDSGVFQVNSIHGIPQRFLFNTKVNIAVARYLYDHSGWQPWAPSRKCHGL